MEDQPTTLWSLERDGHTAACQVKLVTYGIEIILAQDGEYLDQALWTMLDEDWRMKTMFGGGQLIMH